MKSLIDSESVRFVLAGALNTLVTYLFYLLLLSFTPYGIAYSGAFAIGVVSGYTMNTVYVFRRPWAWNILLKFPVVYIVQYVAGMLLLAIFVNGLQVDERVAPLINVVLLLPVTFILSKWIVQYGVQE